MKKEWRPIPDYEELYHLSSNGEVKSLVGWNGRRYIKRVKIISPFKQKAANEVGYRLVVKLTKNKKRTDFQINKLMSEVFG